MYQLGRVKQKDGQTVQDHNANFMRHVTRAQIRFPHADTELLFNIYLQSLIPGLITKIFARPTPPTNLAQAMNAALDENLKYQKLQRFHQHSGHRSTSKRRRFVTIKEKERRHDKKHRRVEETRDRLSI